MNGHRRINCSAYIYEEPKTSNRSLAQAWISMIYQDGATIRNSDYNRETMNEEEHQFNLQYLELRKNLLAKERPDNVLLIRLLDGMFNSNFKVSTIASLLLDDASEEPTRDCEKMGAVQRPLYDVSSASSCSAEMYDKKDVFLLDPCVGFCRNSISPFSPPKELVDQQSIFPAASPPAVCEDISGEDSNRMREGWACTGSSSAKDLGKDSQDTMILPIKPTGPFTRIDSGLTLFNSFELLDVCMEDEYPIKTLDYCTIIPDGGACLPRNLNEKQLCMEDLDSEVNGLNTAGLGLISTAINRSGTLNGCGVENYCLRDTEVIPGEPGYNATVPLCVDAMHLDVVPLILKHADSGSYVNATLRLEEGIEIVHPTVLYCNANSEQVTEFDDSVCVLPETVRTCCSSGPKLLFLGDTLTRCEEALKSTIQAAVSPHEGMTASPDCPSSSYIVGDVEPGMATPPSGNRRGRKKKGFYTSNIVRRSARLGRAFDRSVLTDGDLSESGVVGTSDSDTDG